MTETNDFVAIDKITTHWIKTQTSDAMKQGKVTCRCSTEMPLWAAFRCLYCGEYMCQSCAEKHFGKTRIQYNAERALKHG